MILLCFKLHVRALSFIIALTNFFISFVMVDMEMNLLEHLNKYENLQAEILKEIATFSGVEKIEDINEDELWEFEAELTSGWKINPHGEHLHCINQHQIKIELPLYVSGYIGIDAGHFNNYLASIRINNCSYHDICQILESSNQVKKISPMGTAPVWKLI